MWVYVCLYVYPFQPVFQSKIYSLLDPARFAYVAHTLCFGLLTIIELGRFGLTQSGQLLCSGGCDSLFVAGGFREGIVAGKTGVSKVGVCNRGLVAPGGVDVSDSVFVFGLGETSSMEQGFNGRSSGASMEPSASSGVHFVFSAVISFALRGAVETSTWTSDAGAVSTDAGSISTGRAQRDACEEAIAHRPIIRSEKYIY